MPILTRAYIKTSFIYLALALTLGLWLAAGSLLPSPPGLLPVYFHLFLVGWVTQLIIGIGLWMFPKFSREQPRGNERLAWAVFVLLNAGLVLRAIAEPIHATEPAPFWGSLLALSALLQWLGGLGFVALAWPRIKER